jgi:hypothetical protein
VMDALELVLWSSSSVAGVSKGFLEVEEQGRFYRVGCGCSMRLPGQSPWAWSPVCCSTSLPALCPCMSVLL